MNLLERLLHGGRDSKKDDGDGFQPTPPESLMIKAFMPEDRGGFKGFCQALEWAGVSQERQRTLLELYHKEKPKAMRRNSNEERQGS